MPVEMKEKIANINEDHFDPVLSDTDRWSGIPDQTTANDDKVILVLDNGFRILSFGERHAAGAMVHVISPEGYEIAAWSSDEWEYDPECVMGAILFAASGIKDWNNK